MKSLDDKAQGSPEVTLAKQSAPGLYQLEELELYEADDITEEGEFPQFGDFLKVNRPHGGEEWVECPADLARWLVEEIDAETGEWFRILSAQKVDGEWELEIEEADSPD